MVNNCAAGWISSWMEGMFYSMLEVPFRRLVWVETIPPPGSESTCANLLQLRSRLDKMF